MFDLFFVCTFSIALTVASVYCFIKKKYLYFFVPCMLFLPSYFGIELSGAAPLITAARSIYVIFYIYVFINRKRNIELKPIITNLTREKYFLAGYFFLRIVSNLYYVTTYGQAFKTILEIVFEQLFLLIAFYCLDPSKEEIIKLIKVVVYVATSLFVVGICESLFDIRPFDALYTIYRFVVNMHYYRLGLLRATTTMNAPAVYGNMCVLMLPFIFYLYENTRQRRFIVISGLDVLAIIHSGSRSDMLFLIAILFIYAALILKKKERRILFLKNASIVAVFLLVFMCLASIYSENYRYLYVGNGKALLNIVGFDFDLDEGAPENTEGYGMNGGGTISRTRQLTGIYYTAKINPLFGLGSGAQARGDVQYYWQFSKDNEKWAVVHSYDMGIVETFCDEGLMGLI